MLGTRSYNSVATILKNHRENPPPPIGEAPILIHENIRGPGYYHSHRTLKGEKMLIHPTVERLRALGLSAMADAFIEMHNAVHDAAAPASHGWPRSWSSRQERPRTRRPRRRGGTRRHHAHDMGCCANTFRRARI